MIVEKRMSKKRMWQGILMGLAVAGLICFSGQGVSARISPKMDQSTHRLAQSEQPPVFDRSHAWLVAQQKGRRGKLPPEVKSRVRTWNKMSPAEQQRYQQRYQQLQRMSPDERQRYEKLHQRWEQLPPKKRQQIRKKLKQPENLSPQELETIRNWFKK